MGTENDSSQERDESSLLEVAIAGEAFGNGLIAHHDEGCAISQRPTFVAMQFEELDCALE